MSDENVMIDRICLVTGATSGLGAVTARVLAQLGATVIVVGRSSERCVATVSRIKEQTGNPTVDWIQCELSSQQEIRRLVQEFKSRYSKLHVIVNNAGAIFGRRQVSVDGIEMTFAVNHLSHFLLTNLLLDRLTQSAPARIVNVSSVAHEQARIDFDDLQSQRGYRAMKAYAETKLANLLFTYELSRRLEGTDVTANALHPGLVWTKLGFGVGKLGALGQALVHLRYRHFSVNAEDGARTIVFLATSPTVDRVTGKYFIEQEPVPSSERSCDVSAAQRLWDVSTRLTGVAIELPLGSC